MSNRCADLSEWTDVIEYKEDQWPYWFGGFREPVFLAQKNVQKYWSYRYFLGQRFCVLCFKICTPSLLPHLLSGMQISKQNMHWAFDAINSFSPVISGHCNRSNGLLVRVISGPCRILLHEVLASGFRCLVIAKHQRPFSLIFCTGLPGARFRE